LGFDDVDGSGVTPAQSEARRALSGFRDQMLDVEGWLDSDVGVSQPYRPEAIAVFVTGEVDDPAEGAVIETWPLGDLGAIGRNDATPFPCALVEGQDFDVLYAEVNAAGFGTLWRSGELLYYLGLRPLLRDEADCPS